MFGLRQRQVLQFRNWSSEKPPNQSDKMKRPDDVFSSRPRREDPGQGKGGPVGWVNLAFTGVAIASVIGVYVYVRNKKLAERDKERTRSIGQAAIGGSYELVDHEGKVRGSKDFLGKWVLLYFGFTHCPDICPDEMEKLAKVYDILKAEGKKNKKIGDVVPLFITVDPERDTVSRYLEIYF